MSKVGDAFRSRTVFCDFLLLASMSPNVTDSIPPTKSDKTGFITKFSNVFP